ncbi:hypothetical protein TPHA_0E02880 [Tetrapisispora phaffii CBS 4417]|uniref:Heat shock transcription factor n=1 Tax=Tetrapisispora phaffii (strain ATCC 24235 / CBS 4417 / NBRC 1672 / NRRL Y-8282 / UCD 70-5) TaxID=1071381 RepID=G8BU00_TETPH|nr:hypothetical protein TPHA_0E02880 [Tetrapisispora phaffii CBS 4417]CCE63378.1 hypothetical protein TPHA_0E02880 [Tetrapisispora phaffii CBS 4417]
MVKNTAAHNNEPNTKSSMINNNNTVSNKEAALFSPMPELHDGDDQEQHNSINNFIYNKDGKNDNKNSNITVEEIEDITNPSNEFNNMLSPLQFPEEISSSHNGNNDLVDRNVSTSTQLVRRQPNIGLYQPYLSKEGNNYIGTSASDVHLDATSKVSNQPKRTNINKAKPTFVNKVWNMINDPSNNQLIQWADDGKSFFVTNKEDLIREILPKYFKHSNFASFVRQLNMYGWHKIQDVKSGSIQSSIEDKWQFANDYFIRGREDLLEHIVRQKSTPLANQNPTFSNYIGGYNNLLLSDVPNNDAPNSDSNNNASLDRSLKVLLTELETIKYNQMSISKDLSRISKDNEMLWKENMLARDRHRNQQDALEKIFRFITSAIPNLDQKMLTDRIMKTDNVNTVNTLNNLDGMHSNNSVNDVEFSSASNINYNINNDYIKNQTTGLNQMGNTNNKLGVDDVLNFHMDTPKESNYDSNKLVPSEVPPYSQRSLYLLKNRSASGSPHNSDNINDNIIQDSSKFSTNNDILAASNIIGFPPTNNSNQNMNNNGIQKINSHASSLHTIESSGRISEIPPHEDEVEENKRINVATKKAINDTYPLDDGEMFLSHLHNNINEQDARIQHLESLVSDLTPHNFEMPEYFSNEDVNTNINSISNVQGNNIHSHKNTNDQVETNAPLYFNFDDLNTSPTMATDNQNKRIIESADNSPPLLEVKETDAKRRKL